MHISSGIHAYRRTFLSRGGILYVCAACAHASFILGVSSANLQHIPVRVAATPLLLTLGSRLLGLTGPAVAPSYMRRGPLHGFLFERYCCYFLEKGH